MIYAQVDAQAKEALHTEMKAPQDAKWYCRLKVIDLSAQGHSVPELAQMFDFSAGTIRRYIHAFNEAGLAGLQPDYGQGRPLALTWTKEQWLDLLAQAPADLALLETADQNWTQAMEAFVTEHDVQMELVYLPTYSPHLNHIERLWHLMCSRVTRNRFYESLNAVAQAAVDWLGNLLFAEFCSLMGIDESQLAFVDKPFS